MVDYNNHTKGVHGAYEEKGVRIMKDRRRQIWVAPEFHSLLQEMARKEQNLLKLRKRPSTVDITHKLAHELRKKKERPLRFNLLK